MNTVYLCAPVNALVEGIYEEKIPFSKVKQHGDFGLGTFDHLDGEMIMLDGKVFQINADGWVHEEDDQALTPFCCVTFFNSEKVAESDQEMPYPAFLTWLRTLLPSPNLFYALRIEGRFASLKARSVPKQECYRPLVEVAKEQHVFEFEDVQGTLAGFYTPDFMGSLNVPGLHLHFLSEDHTRGGHLLECRPKKVRAQVQILSKLELGLPMNEEYLHWDFHRDISRDLDAAEH